MRVSPELLADYRRLYEEHGGHWPPRPLGDEYSRWVPGSSVRSDLDEMRDWMGAADGPSPADQAEPAAGYGLYAAHVDDLRDYYSLSPAHETGQILVGETPAATMRGFVRKTENGVLCVFSEGMRRFLFNAATLLGRLVVESPPDSQTASGHTPWHPHRLDVTEQHLGTVAYNLIWLASKYLAGRPFFEGESSRPEMEARHRPREMELTQGAALPPRTAMSNTIGACLSHSMGLFVVGHELAHLDLKHLGRRVQLQALSSNLEARLPRRLRKKLKAGRQLEYEADALSQRVLFELALARKGWSLGGGLMFVRLMSFVDGVASQLGRFGVSQPDYLTHPLPMKRYAELNRLYVATGFPYNPVERGFIEWVSRVESLVVDTVFLPHPAGPIPWIRVPGLGVL